MKTLYKKIATTSFLVIVSIFFLASCMAEKKPAPPAKTTMQKEILVVKDIGGVMPFHTIGWCGNTGLWTNNDKFGKKWVGLDGKSITISTENIGRITGCTPDGKWIIYTGKDSARIYKNKLGKLPKYTVDDGPGWHGFVFDLYRYEIATGKHQRFAVVRDDSDALVSPDGTKVLLGNRHDSAIKTPNLKWKKVWLTNEWLYGTTRWLADSSGVATLIWSNGHNLGIEIFDKKNGWAKEYNLESLGFGPKPNRSIHLDIIDKDNRLYFTVIEGGENYATSKFSFLRCEIKDRKINCEVTGEFNERGRDIKFYEILSNGDFTFIRDNDNCIRRLKPGQADGKCIADLDYGGTTYEEIHLIGASPDGKHVAFRRSKKPPEPKGRSYGFQYDLFVKELSED